MQTVTELKKYIKALPNTPTYYNIAVGSLIFTPEDTVILVERGPAARDERGKLEGVGGGVDKGEEDLHQALLREIHEELGDIEVHIEKQLAVIILPGERELMWVVVNYLCTLVSGTPENKEPDKCAKLHFLKIKEIDDNKLSLFQKAAMVAYRKT